MNLGKEEEKTKMLHAMKTVKEIFKKHNIHYWLDRGTLLAVVRHGDFIPWDDDVDIGLWYTSILDIFKTKADFEKTPYELYYTNGHFSIRDRETKDHMVCLLFRDLYEGKYQWTYYYPPLTFLIFLLEANDEKYIEDSMKIKPNFAPFVRIFRHIPKDGRVFLEEILLKIQITFKLFRRFTKASDKSFLEFSTCKFYGETYPVPTIPEVYLKEFYGENWKTPMYKGKVITEWENKPIRIL
jgi:hypothetical protein